MISGLILAFVLSLVPSGAGAGRAPCVGDCDENGTVDVGENVLGIGIALGQAALPRCPQLDRNGDRAIGIDELIASVDSSVHSCEPSPAGPRLVTLSRDGKMASLDLAAPWTVRATGDLGSTVASARCRAGRCLVVHPSPADSISIVDAADLSLIDTVGLARDSDPRDVALVDDRTAVVSLHGEAELLVMDLDTGQTSRIDLSALADGDGLPESLRLAHCGRRVFVQLRRVDHESGAPSSLGAVLAVVDLDRDAGDQIVDADPDVAGVQGIALADRPDFDMPVDCGAGVLYVAEPRLLMQGGGDYEQVDLDSLTASVYPVDTGAEVGGFEVIEPDKYWLITHTTTGPGPSSHLNFFDAGGSSDTFNTFAMQHIDDLAFAAEEDLLFYPDGCFKFPANQSCDAGIVPFHAHTGERASAEPVRVGFAPVEVAVSR